MDPRRRANENRQRSQAIVDEKLTPSFSESLPAGCWNPIVARVSTVRTLILLASVNRTMHKTRDEHRLRLSRYLFESHWFSRRDSAGNQSLQVDQLKRLRQRRVDREGLTSAARRQHSNDGLCQWQRGCPPTSSRWKNPSPGLGIPRKAEDRRGSTGTGVRCGACDWWKEGKSNGVSLRLLERSKIYKESYDALTGMKNCQKLRFPLIDLKNFQRKTQSKEQVIILLVLL